MLSFQESTPILNVHRKKKVRKLIVCTSYISIYTCAHACSCVCVFVCVCVCIVSLKYDINTSLTEKEFTTNYKQCAYFWIATYLYIMQ